MPPWSCGSPITYDSKEYTTVEIGSQCWMAENINVGTRTNGTNSQGTDCPSALEIEKYCYSDVEANCTSDGGLYQWNQAMCGSTTEGAQGICPSGWHIPTDAEFKTLEGTVDSTYGVGDPEWDGTLWRGDDAGGKLKGETICGAFPCWDAPNTGATNSSGFTAWAAGYRSTGGSFVNRGTDAYVWSSLESGTNAWIRVLFSTESRVYRFTDDKAFGFSVRCLKD